MMKKIGTILVALAAVVALASGTAHVGGVPDGAASVPASGHCPPC